MSVREKQVAYEEEVQAMTLFPLLFLQKPQPKERGNDPT